MARFEKRHGYSKESTELQTKELSPAILVLIHIDRTGN